MRALSTVLRSTVRPVVTTWSHLSTLSFWPYGAVDYLGMPLRPAKGTHFAPVRLPSARAEMISQTGRAPKRYYLYLHGGAFLVGGHYLHRQLISHLVLNSDAAALAVDYRMLPRYTVRDAVQDCLDGYRYLLAQGIGPERIVFAGDSAGGFLVFATALAAQQAGLPVPSGIVSISPLTDFSTDKFGGRKNGKCALFNQRAIEHFLELTRTESRHGGVEAPTAADVHGLPPTLLQAAGRELLYPDAVRMADHLAAAGVPTELQTWDTDLHVFQAAARITPEGTQAITQIADFARAVTGAAVPQSVRAG